MFGVALLACAPATGQAEPVIGPDGIVNVASQIPSGLPNSGIAQCSLFVAFDNGLGHGGLRADYELPWAAELAGITASATLPVP